MNFCKTREVKDPIRANITDAGIDFFVPTDIKKTEFIDKQTNNVAYDLYGELLVKSITIYPHSRVLIPAGIHMNL